MHREDSTHVATSVARGACHRGTTDFSFACAVCRSPEAFRQIVRGPVRGFLPHTGLIAAMGLGEGDGTRLRCLMGIDVPSALANESERRVHPSLQELVRKWFKCRQPVLLKPPRGSGAVTRTDADAGTLRQAGRIAIHGEVDLYTRAWSYFIFTGIPAAMATPTVAHRLKLLAPMLSAPLMKLVAASATSQTLLEELSAAERQLLQWIVEGCSNPEIASLSGSRLAVVRTQVLRLYAKLGVKNRGEAIRVGAPVFSRTTQCEAAAESC